MIYTIGHRDSYLRVLEDSNPTKIGPRKLGDPGFEDEPYGGGIAFIEAVEAREYLNSRDVTDYGVFALDGEPEDTEEILSGELRIKRDLRILHEVTVEG